MTRIYGLCLVVLVAVSLLSGAVCAGDRETMFQVATLDGLMAGLYDGSWTFNQLKSHGDFGVGTFDKLDGEMIALDGKFYRVAVDGKVNLVPGKETTPFSCITFFDKDGTIDIPAGTDFKSLPALLDSKLPTTNVYQAIRIDGEFTYMKTRSVPAQAKPYPPLAEVTKKQAVFEFSNVTGTIVGIRGPYYVKGANLPGYHFHFITKDRKAGGHVLDLTIGTVKATYDETRNYTVIVPPSSDFDKTDFTVPPSTAHVE